MDVKINNFYFKLSISQNVHVTFSLNDKGLHKFLSICELSKQGNEVSLFIDCWLYIR